MDKPNVIYAAAYDPSLERGFLTCSTVPMKHDDVKYIRKDALLEWAKERREAVAKEVVIQEGVRPGVDAAFEELIDKLNEM